MVHRSHISGSPVAPAYGGNMIIEQSGKALELDTGPFRVYGTKEELKALGYQVAQGADKVHTGWVEVDSSKGMVNAEIKPQNPKTMKWME